MHRELQYGRDGIKKYNLPKLITLNEYDNVETIRELTRAKGKNQEQNFAQVLTEINTNEDYDGNWAPQ